MQKIIKEFHKEIETCQRAKNKERLSALRLLKAEFESEVKDRSAKNDDSTFVTTASKLYKQMEKSLEIAEDKKNRMLMKVCEEYMPKIASKEEIDKFLSKQAKGILMKALKEKFGASLNGRLAIQSVAGVLK